MEPEGRLQEQGYLCLAGPVNCEIAIKKSRFICDLIPVETEKQAAEEIAKVKKRHYDARHHCFAMILGPRRDMEKSSDDGEPQGTAGVPMLEVLRRSGLTNLLAVVTRYFGGTLLGAGGLVRAYSGAAAQAIAQAQAVRIVPAVVLDFEIGYADFSKLQSIAAEYNTKVEAEYGETIRARIIVQKQYMERMAKKIREAFLGADVYTVAGECVVAQPQERLP